VWCENEARSISRSTASQDEMKPDASVIFGFDVNRTSFGGSRQYHIGTYPPFVNFLSSPVLLGQCVDNGLIIRVLTC